MAANLEGAPASQVMGWAVQRFGAGLVVASSFQDCVLIDLATAVDPGVEVVFLDTGAHFAETLAYVEVVQQRYDLNLVVLHPTAGADEWPCGSARCCELRKVAPLVAHLAGRGAWATGLRRADSPLRADAPVVSWDQGRGVVKLNPLAAWTDTEMAAYVSDHELPVHPLSNSGYASIGCAPTTAPVAVGADPRSGRWAGSAKTECGLHL
ncbi:MAG: phosphoadenylyl-sulfate reductase [Acidimicrobiales bacterium]